MSDRELITVVLGITFVLVSIVSSFFVLFVRWSKRDKKVHDQIVEQHVGE